MTTTFKNVTNGPGDITLNGAISDVATSLTLNSDPGSDWPTSTFWVTCENEIILVGTRSGTSCTSLTRGQQGTSGAAHADAKEIYHNCTAQSVLDLNTAVNKIEDGTTTLDSVTTNGDITVGDDGSGNIVTGTGNTTVALLNTIATTVNAFGAATTITAGAATGTFTINNATTAIVGGATVGGGYGSTGASISDAGVGQFNGALTTDGALTADSAEIGGGYGSTGASISAAGVAQFNGALTTDGALTADSAAIGGGYGSTGASISNAGVGQFNGAVTTDGALACASATIDGPVETGGISLLANGIG